MDTNKKDETMSEKKELTFTQKLIAIQSELKAPKVVINIVLVKIFWKR